MQSVRSRIWTRVAVSISCDDNHYTIGTSNFVFNETPGEKTRFLLYKNAVSSFEEILETAS